MQEVLPKQAPDAAETNGKKEDVEKCVTGRKRKRKKQESNAAVEAELTLSIHAAQHHRGEYTLADTIRDGHGVKKARDQLINNSRRSVNYSPPRLFIVLPNIANKVFFCLLLILHESAEDIWKELQLCSEDVVK